ncbi:MAG: DUF362 domain-containing protein [Candidatus Bathyarchaeota archaeon]|jgi:uncharacterized protein (DUF362 family)
MKSDSSELVALVDTSRYADLTDAIIKALELINFNFGKKPKKVAIKTNMCYYWQSTTGETTDPKVIEAIIDVLRIKFNPDEILVVESDATAMRAKHAFKTLGYEKLAAKKKVKLLNLCEEETLPVPNETSSISKKIKIPKILTEVDLFISVPKLKLHRLVGVTCSLKNQFGCIPVQRKVGFHNQLKEAIALINKHVPPDLIIVDGIIAGGKTPKKLDLIMASSDPVAVDSVAAKIAGFNPKRIKHIVESEKTGVGSTNFQCVGDDIQHFINKFPRKGFVSSVARSVLLKVYTFYLRHFTLEGKLFKKQPSLGG